MENIKVNTSTLNELNRLLGLNLKKEDLPDLINHVDVSISDKTSKTEKCEIIIRHIHELDISEDVKKLLLLLLYKGIDININSKWSSKNIHEQDVSPCDILRKEKHEATLETKLDPCSENSYVPVQKTTVHTSTDTCAEGMFKFLGIVWLMFLCLMFPALLSECGSKSIPPYKSVRENKQHHKIVDNFDYETFEKGYKYKLKTEQE